MVFAAGQAGLDPEARKLVDGGIDAETRQVLTNLRNVLEATGSGMSYVVKTTVYLVDMNDFAAMNAVYASFFPENPPARTTMIHGSLWCLLVD
jgi:2-iminobutanoate/2-iminopropanoate deaminase